MIRKKWSLVFYVLMLGGFAVLLYWVLQYGQQMESRKAVSPVHETVKPAVDAEKNRLLFDTFGHHLLQPLPVLLLQIMVIVLVARFFGILFNKMGHPAVVGEIVAGVALGPSLLGYCLPAVADFLFPAASMGNLQFLSQVGLILFMFVIGMELDASLLRKQAYEAVIISHASIVIPYALGLVLACFLYPSFAPPHVSFLSFSLFMGIAMSITAFPVLARMLQERAMTGTRLGTMALTCAASDDVTAWCILAVLIAIIKAESSVSAFFMIGLVLLYIGVMAWLVRPALRRLYMVYGNRPVMSKTILALVFMVLLLSAYLTEAIGIHALFGSFMAGVIMPGKQEFRKRVTDKIEDISVVLLLPLFFVFTGLRTRVGLLNQGYLWAAAGWILLAAVAGKFGGGTLSAKITGQNWKDSFSIGVLMNTRGLMELVVLNIGYDLGILSPEIFTMMVLMALLTTLMTGPALNLINRIAPH